MTTLISVPAGRSFRREGSKFIDARPTKGTIEIVRIEELVEFSELNQPSESSRLRGPRELYLYSQGGSTRSLARQTRFVVSPIVG